MLPGPRLCLGHCAAYTARLGVGLSLGNGQAWFTFAEQPVLLLLPSPWEVRKGCGIQNEKHSLVTTAAYPFLYTRFRSFRQNREHIARQALPPEKPEICYL